MTDVLRIDYVLPDAQAVAKGHRRRAPVPSLTMALLMAQTPKQINGAPVEASVHVESMMGAYYVSKRRPDILGLSFLTTGAPRAYQILREARDCRAHSGGKIKTLVGGIHPSSLPQEALQCTETVVCGETPPELQHEVLTWLAGQGNGDIEPRVFRLGEMQRHDVLVRPCPDFSWMRPKDYMVPQVVQTSVGCPYNCSFCTATRVYGSTLRPVAYDLLERDVAALGPGLVAIVDDNFLARRPYDHARKVCDILGRHGRTWVAELTARDLHRDEELIPLFARSGCMGVYIGIENVRVKLAKGLYPEQYKELIARCHEHGLLVLGAFVFGVDENEDEGIYEETVAFGERIALDFAQFSVNTPEPGSADFETAARAGIITDWNWEHYDGTYPVRLFKNISAEKMYEGIGNAYRWFYSMGSIRRRLTPIGSWRHLRAWPYNLYLGGTVRLWKRRRNFAQYQAKSQDQPSPAVASMFAQ